MKLAKGVTIHIGREKFTGEIPDDKAKALGLMPVKKEQPKDEPKK
jgi:hypothetical protein